MSLSVLIPYRSDCCYRSGALWWVAERWKATIPGAEIIVGSGTEGPWRKAAAVEDCLARSRGKVLIITDADVWADRAVEAVDLVVKGKPWATPHNVIHRLSQAVSAEIVQGADPAEAFRRAGSYALAEARYEGKVGGGVVVISRDAYEVCPMDQRFSGWGGEDESWGWALETLVGNPARLQGPLWHLWHPPAERMSRTVGSAENDALRRRYHGARWLPDAMRQIVAEA